MEANIDFSDLQISMVNSTEDYTEIQHLRKDVYVDGENRLASVEDMRDTFDKYNSSSVYFLARYKGQPVGCVKVYYDDGHGLPCQEIVNLSAYGNSSLMVEFGHLVTVREIRSKKIGSALMRAALIYSIRERNASHIIGDFFIDKTVANRLHPFYETLGFECLCEPYPDERFEDSPLSIVAILEIKKSLYLWKNGTPKQQALLDFFYHDYESFAYPQRETVSL